MPIYTKRYMKEKHNKKKKLQIGLRRLYSTKNPSKEILKYLSIDKESFIDYINSKLLDGMTMENFGPVWGIDHIVPVELFDLNSEDDLKICYNFINIIPMFNNDNRFKGGSVHFSVILLNNTIQKEKVKIHQNILLKLLAKCEEEIVCRYNKYLLL